MPQPDSVDAGAELRHALAKAEDTVMVYSADGRVTRTGGELLERAERLAGALLARHLEGTVIGLYYRNSAAALEAFIATELIGATRLPVEPRAAWMEARATFEAGGVTAILTDLHTSYSETGKSSWWEDSSFSTNLLVHTDDFPLSGSRWGDTIKVDPNRTLVLYPRVVRQGQLFGIPTSYANWRAILAVNADLYASGEYGMPLRGDDRYLTMLPLMHLTGMVGSFPFLLRGLPQVLMSRFNAREVITTIEHHRVTTLFAVPGMLRRIAEELPRFSGQPLSSLRRVLYGAAPVSTDEVKRLVGVFGPRLTQLYGRYEAGWPLAVLNTADHEHILLDDPEVVGSCGRPIAAAELKLTSMSSLSTRCEVKSRSLMVSAEFADADGWCSLGDTGTLSASGYLHLTGRNDGMINTGGFHVYPQEVEEAILALPGVGAVAVRGESDPTWGETVVAYVVSTDDALASSVRDQLRPRLATYKIPTAVHLVDRLPRSDLAAPGRH